VFEAFLRARRILALAAIAVFLASAVIVPAFYRRIAVPCHGGLEEVPVSELPNLNDRKDVAGGDGVYLDADPKSRDIRLRLGTDCACKDELSFKWGRFGNVSIYRNRETGLYAVREEYGPDVFAFRRTNVSGHVFKWRKALDTGNVSMLILLGAMGSLLGAYLLSNRAASYALTMRDWRSARRREDGLLEDESGAIVARLGRVSFREADVLVDPRSIEGRAVYRELPMLSRREVAPGDHARWSNGTYRRFRDAKVLAVLATLTTALSVGAHFFAS
jgi:hypothetical protein